MVETLDYAQPELIVKHAPAKNGGFLRGRNPLVHFTRRVGVSRGKMSLTDLAGRSPKPSRRA